MSYAEFVARLRARPRAAVLFGQPGELPAPCPSEALFFCTTCPRLVSEETALAELDAFYCPVTLTAVLSSQAFQDGGRSKKSMDCPVCFHTLSVVSKDTKQHFLCEHCTWSSLDADLAAENAQALFTATEDAEKKRHPVPAFRELLELTRKRFLEASKASDRPVIEAAPPRPRHETPVEAIRQLDAQLTRQAEARRPLARPRPNNDHVKPADSAFVDKFDVNKVATLEQRLALPCVQPTFVSALLPARRQLGAKLAFRCQKCSKLVSKPKMGATNNTYEKQLLAVQLLPVVTVQEIPQGKLQRGKELKTVLYFRNPLKADVVLSFAELKAEDTGRAPAATCKVALPTGKFNIAMYDEALEEQEPLPEERKQQQGGDKPKTPDEAKFLASRHANKIGLHFTLQPLSAKPTDDVVFRFALTVDSQNTQISEFASFSFHVYVNLGPCDQA